MNMYFQDSKKYLLGTNKRSVAELQPKKDEYSLEQPAFQKSPLAPLYERGVGGISAGGWQNKILFP